ncbi:penicillin-binding transpeptidase domain-containing protein [Bacillus sp. JCM 19041]|uniref:penicillin-binding transpeptidase domain-containing protein n=1 Tax=Bacillus sp. JCM 19041 TaxID=1460637 RepID=UPI0006D1F12D
MSGYADPKDGAGAFQPLGTVNDAYEFGSAIKGASVLTGLEYDVIHPSTVVDDQPLYFKGTPDKKSVVPYMGPVDLNAALERSSNVYMFEIALRMGGYQYDYHSAARQTLFSEEVANQVLDDARYVFHQFGLGVNTGIDLPTEATGLAQPVNEAGNALDFMIGQYDTYSTLQVAQYISTIANDG